MNPDFVIDVSDHWEKKMDSIRAFKTQFYDPKSNEPATYISSPAFMKMLESRAQEFGHAVGVKYGEGFTVRRFIGVDSLFDLR
jgi:LmbE family N-acetylglucosaminyl deacetylase